MRTQLIIQLYNIAGGQLRIVNCMRTMNLRTVSHSLKPTQEGEKVLMLEMEGPQVPEDELRTKLEALRGVKTVDKIYHMVPGAKLEEAPIETEAVKEAVAAAAAPARKPTPELDTRFKNKDSEAGDVEMRDRMLIFSMLSRYPKIANRLHEIRSTIPAEEQMQRMLELGQGFGRYVYANLKVKQPVNELLGCMQLVIMPAFNKVAKVTQYGNILEFSASTLNLKSEKAIPESCQFTIGMLEGLLEKSEGLPPHTVVKTKCTHNGDAVCEYSINEN